MARQVVALQRVLLTRAQWALDRGVYLPGYTHLQRAQPVLLAHHLLAHGWALARDVDRLLDTRRRLDVSPLGRRRPGRLVPAPRPRRHRRATSGFAAAFENSLDAVGDRDFVAEALFDLALLGVHLSRIGEEVVLWSSGEFGFLRLADEWATGSSMLPQKKNPDVAELARGKAGRLIGHLTGRAGRPQGPAPRLQPRPPGGQGAAVRRRRPGGPGPRRPHRPAGDGHLRRAPDGGRGRLAGGGRRRPGRVDGGRGAWPFRDAHGIVAGLVRESLDRHVPLAELVAASPHLGADAVALLEPGVARHPPHHARRGRARRRWPSSCAASGPASRSTRNGWPAVDRSEPASWPGTSTAATASRSPPTCSTSCWSGGGAGSGGSSRWRPTAGRTTPPATPSGAGPPATPPCSARPATSTSTSPTACTSAPTWCAARRARRRPCSCGA